jgi:hypothetical protein
MDAARLTVLSLLQEKVGRTDLPAGAPSAPIADIGKGAARYKNADSPTGLEGHDPRYRPIPIRDDYLGTLLDRPQMLRQPIFQFGNLHSSHVHI